MSKINGNQKLAHYCSLFSGWNNYLKQQLATLFKYCNVHLLIICWAGKQLNKNRWLASFMLHINLCYCIKWLQSRKPGFHMSGKSQTIGDFTFFRPSQILPIYQMCARGLSQIFLIMNYLFVIGGTGAPQFRGLAMSEINRRRMLMSRRYKFEFSFFGNDRRPSQKSGTHQENRNAPDSPVLSWFIPNDQGYLRFWVFISWQILGRSGNSKIPDRLGCSRHMKNRLKVKSRTASSLICSVYLQLSLTIFEDINVHLRTLSVGFETKDSSKLLFRQLYTLQSHINIFTHIIQSIMKLWRVFVSLEVSSKSW